LKSIFQKVVLPYFFKKYISKSSFAILFQKYILKAYIIMDDFQKIVILIAIILLIIFLILIGIALYRNKSTYQYPPVIANCPDYWLDESDGSVSKCVNVKNLGNSKCPKTLDFSSVFWSSDKGPCAKKKLAQGCDLTWDGVTNNNSMKC